MKIKDPIGAKGCHLALGVLVFVPHKLQSFSSFCFSVAPKNWTKIYLSAHLSPPLHLPLICVIYYKGLNDFFLIKIDDCFLEINEAKSTKSLI